MYKISFLRKVQPLVRLSLLPNSDRLSTLNSRVMLLKRFASSIFFKENAKEVRYLHCLPFDSSNNKLFKGEPPAGISAVLALNHHPGQSFNVPSRYVNIYPKRRNLSVFAGNASFIVTVPEYHNQSQRRTLNQWSEADQNEQGSSCKVPSLKCKEKSETVTSINEKSGLQLFHISSLTTAFGESYSYVAKHINSVFSQSYTRSKQEIFQGLSTIRGANRRVRRKKQTHSDAISEVKLNDERIAVGHDNVFNSWEEAYHQIARHINKYFMAKSADEAYSKKELLEEKNKSKKKYVFPESTSETGSGII
ncbi:PREDICTED: uncharacterized protein LOC107083906 [Cyprinodon variegatus]|uniref:uncharacterized protein LOC107083906 n=1 Tax=Cyprinodon variegatus TaxID=28743 RepID=UPI000742731F|nr:PREDICTED: uncharacterized protein LOC107083906 [Cyprinodon variegatus]